MSTELATARSTDLATARLPINADKATIQTLSLCITDPNDRLKTTLAAKEDAKLAKESMSAALEKCISGLKSKLASPKNELDIAADVISRRNSELNCELVTELELRVKFVVEKCLTHQP